jgi:hypothetical protein
MKLNTDIVFKLMLYFIRYLGNYVYSFSNYSSPNSYLITIRDNKIIIGDHPIKMFDNSYLEIEYDLLKEDTKIQRGSVYIRDITRMRSRLHEDYNFKRI